MFFPFENGGELGVKTHPTKDNSFPGHIYSLCYASHVRLLFIFFYHMNVAGLTVQRAEFLIPLRNVVFVVQIHCHDSDS